MHRLLALGAPEYTLFREQWVPCGRREAFQFFCDPHNLPRITPPWLGFNITSLEPLPIQRGTMLAYRLRWLGIPYTWKTLIDEWTPDAGFSDYQARGPYILWRHLHRFEPAGSGTLMTDRVTYRLPFGPLGMLTHSLIVRRQLREIFDYRMEKIAEILSGGIVHAHAPHERTARRE